MENYIIMTDSCCDLPEEYIKNKYIPFVELTCSIKDREYVVDFGKNLDYKFFYEQMRKGEIPKTSQPSVDAFYKKFKAGIEEGKKILYICVSSALSGTFNSACIARNMIIDEKKDAVIVIVDSLAVSLGQGLLVMKAVEMREKGAGFEETVKFVEDNKYRVNTYITVEDLIHLKRGGRISSAAALLGTVLHIKPVLTISDEGKVIPAFKAKGRKNAITKIVEFLQERIEESDQQTIMICHGDAQDEAEKLKEIILEKVHAKDIMLNYIGPVVGTYGGPGTLAVIFFGKHRQNHVIDVNIKARD